jgi:hypothetical protein
MVKQVYERKKEDKEKTKAIEKAKQEYQKKIEEYKKEKERNSARDDD